MTTTDEGDTTRTSSASALKTALRSTAISFARSTRLENNARDRISPNQCDDSTHVATDELIPDAITKLDVHPAIDASFPPPSMMSSRKIANAGWRPN